MTSANIGRAHRLLTLILFGALLTYIVGGSWDAYWHITQPLDDFFSPPHIFVYAMATLLGLAVMEMVFTPSTRAAFGVGFRPFFLPFRVPGALFLFGAGFVVLGFAGLVLDNFWHSNFGLNETAWSAPHAMIGWALLLLVFGYAACRLALRPARPLHWYTTLVIGLLALLLSAGLIMGPFVGNNTPAMVEAQRRYTPGIAIAPERQQVYQLYIDHNLTRTSPLLTPLAALWIGAALAFVRRLDRRVWMILLITGMWTLLIWSGELGAVNTYDEFVPALRDDPRNWAPIPLVHMALVYVALRRFARRPSQTADAPPERAWLWVLIGLLSALLLWDWFKPDPAGWWVLLVAPLAALVGRWLGDQAYTRLERPAPHSVILPVWAAALIVPLAVGAVDLWLRAGVLR